jgi:hypothetical protein
MPSSGAGLLNKGDVDAQDGGVRTPAVRVLVLKAWRGELSEAEWAGAGRD